MGFKDLGTVAAEDVPGYSRCPVLPPANDQLAWQASVASSLLATFQQDNQPDPGPVRAGAAPAPWS